MSINMSTLFGRINHRTIQRNYSAPSQPQIGGFMRINMQRSIPISTPVPPIQPMKLVNENAVKSSSTMTWGKPTWFFFHTLAEKIRDEEFSCVRADVLDIIYSVATNLPCPDCANHAKTYLDKINFNTIQTKSDLKMMLFIFHNFVNERKGYSMFTIDELNSLYPTANTTNIFNNFLLTYLKKNSTPKMMANEMYRRRIIYKTRDWLNTNSYKFLP